MSAHVIKLICPNLLCRTILSVPVRARGKDVRCRACGTKLRVPMTPPAKAKPAPAATAPASDGGGGEDATGNGNG